MEERETFNLCGVGSIPTRSTKGVIMDERVQRWARQGVSMDVTTAILRGEGWTDEEIRMAYEQVLADGAVLEVERGTPTITYDALV
jgi:hypothetical protein